MNSSGSAGSVGYPAWSSGCEGLTFESQAGHGVHNEDHALTQGRCESARR